VVLAVIYGLKQVAAASALALTAAAIVAATILRRPIHPTGPITQGDHEVEADVDFVH
jgi:hypothetical protein